VPAETKDNFLCKHIALIESEAGSTGEGFFGEYPKWCLRTIDITFPKGKGLPSYRACLDRICLEAEKAVDEGVKVMILSDRAVGPQRVMTSSLTACGGVHHHLVSLKKRSKAALMVETGEAKEVHHLCVLVGYGADAICPWLVQEVVYKIHREGL
jgi:glutamate synthase (NADPH/NADH)